jgi:hypothetical protein
MIKKTSTAYFVSVALVTNGVNGTGTNLKALQKTKSRTTTVL